MPVPMDGKLICFRGLLLAACFHSAGCAAGNAQPPAVMNRGRNFSSGLTVPQLYTQSGNDPVFEELLQNERLPIGSNSTQGVKGSTISVNKVLVEQAGGGFPIPQNIRIHTLGNSVIPRKYFERWSRWYQEEGNTQVFRLFKGEHNVRNERPEAARIEAFSDMKWQRGQWHEWEGTFTIVKPHGCAIFQAKNHANAWSVMISMSDEGDITLNHRRHQRDVIIARNMTGRSFTLKVRDNGYDYEVYFNGEKVGSGYFDRPEGYTCFRWGMYLGAKEVRHDAMIFVTGARFK
jgi:hypothetical protein